MMFKSSIIIFLSIGSAAAFSPITVPTSTSFSSSTPSELYMNRKRSSSKKKKSGGGSKGFGAALRNLQANSFQYAGTILPGNQSPQKVVIDEAIMKPDYVIDGKPKAKPQMLPWIIEVKKADEILKMRAAGKVAREVLDTAGAAIAAGVTTDEIDNIVHAESLKRGAYPSPLNYHGFPKSCCTSINEVICHGIPDDRKLVEGDIVNLDITCYLDGYHGDCSEMFVVGDTDDESKKLIQATYDCWVKAMEFVQPGRDYKDIGAIIEDHVTERGFTTVKNFCGHGIGSVFHTNPNIFHYRNSEPNGQMAPGHTFTIEPMICQGTSQALSWPDNWTATTRDGKRTAQFEHTLLITPDGVEALTGKLETSPLQFWERESEVHKGFWVGTTPAARERSLALSALKN
jgi:methionyl aminopeptidase